MFNYVYFGHSSWKSYLHLYHLQLCLLIFCHCLQTIQTGLLLSCKHPFSFFRLSQITPITCPHPLHYVWILFFTSLVHWQLLWMFDTKYLNLCTFVVSTPSSFTVPPVSLSVMHMDSVSFLLTCIPLLPRADLHLFRRSSTFSLLSQQIAELSSNIIVYGDYCLT